MTDADEREWWRVGYHADPVGFVPKELCAWNHRFDDRRRRQNVLVKVHPVLTGPLVDLCDPDVRYEVERANAAILYVHGMDHLDLSQITSKLRPVTQTIAADLPDRLSAAAVQFPSGLDGKSCVAVWEGRGALEIIDDQVALTDPPPSALQAVCTGWRLEMEPSAAVI